MVTVCPTTVLTFVLLLALLFVAQLKSLSALIFLMAGLWLVVRRPQDMLDELARYWWVFLIPVWCLLTTLWSAYPALTLRYSIQLGLTILISVSIAARLSPRNFVLVLFLAYVITALAGLGFGRIRGDGGGWLGIFGSKNAYSFAMSGLLLVSFSLALVPGATRRWRIAGAIGMVLGAFLLLKGQSAGALLTTSMAAFAGLIFIAIRRLDGIQKLVLATVSILALLVLALLALANLETLMDLLLESTGKDATLTGRTELWAEAVIEWERNPLFGQGYQAVWVVGNPVAERMWDMFGISNKIGFHFHNNWLSNAVELGLIGVTLQGVALLGAVYLTFRWAIVSPRPESVFLAIFMLRQLVLSGVEVLLFFQFDLSSLVTICALIYGLRARAEAAKAR